MSTVISEVSSSPDGYTIAADPLPHDPTGPRGQILHDHRLATDVLRAQGGVDTEIVASGGAVFDHFLLPATLNAAVAER